MSASLSSAVAPAPWPELKIEAEIAAKVLYVPISDPSVTAIEIFDCREELIDLLTVENTRLKPLAGFDQKYVNTYSGYSQIRLGVYKKLLAMLEILPINVGIAYFEGFRPLSKQKEYFDKKFTEILAVIPDLEQAYMETTKHVSPFIANIPPHTTGAAIDMTLFTTVEDGSELLLDMGKFDVIFGPNDQQETFSTNTTDIQKKNRLLLLNAALKSGFANYGFEWWHYSFGDKMHAKVYQEKNACYDLLADKNNPILTISKQEYFKNKQ